MKAVSESLLDPDGRVRNETLRALWEIGSGQSRDILIGGLADINWWDRSCIAWNSVMQNPLLIFKSCSMMKTMKPGFMHGLP
jgi:hypothetical protein